MPMKRPAEEALRWVLAELRNAPDRLATVLDAHPEALVAFASDRTILAANEPAERYFGYGRGELASLSTDTLLPHRLRQPDAPPQIPIEDLTTVELPALRKDGVEVATVWIFGFAPSPRGPIFVVTTIDRAKLLADFEVLRRSDARYRSLLVASSSIVWIATASGEFVEPQPAWEAYTGQSWEEHRGSNWIAAIHPDDRARVMDDWATAVRSGAGAYRTHGRVWSAKHGAWRAFQTRGVPVRDEAGGILEWVGALTDVEDTLEAVQRAREDAERARALLSTAQEAASIGVFEWDGHSNDVYWTPELYALLGRRPGEIEATVENFVAHAHPDDRGLGMKAFHEASANRTPLYHHEQRMLHPDGRMRWLRMTNHLTFDEAGRVTRCIGAAVDVTELKELAARERAARLEAEAANRAKDEFLATMSHELRTPLNAILGWSTILRQGPRTAEKLERGLEVIERNARSQGKLVSDLLDLSRIVSGKLRIHLRRTELSGVLHAAADVVRPAAETKGVRLVVDVDPEIGSTVADPDRLQQILWNLLSNAVRFTPRGGCVSAGRVPIAVGRPDRDHGHRRGHRSGAAPSCLRPLPAGRQLHQAQPRRPGPRPLDRAAPGRGARRDRIGAESRARTRSDVRGATPHPRRGHDQHRGARDEYGGAAGRRGRRDVRAANRGTPGARTRSRRGGRSRLARARRGRPPVGGGEGDLLLTSERGPRDAR